MKNVTGVATIGVLSALAVTGWMQQPQPAAVAFPASAAGSAYVQPAFSTASLGFQPLVQQPVLTEAAADAAPVLVADRRGARSYRNGSDGNNRRAARYNDSRYRNDDDRYRGRYDDRGYRDSDRSTGKSVAIVAGSAAAGAAIGGLAKGGKGAAIGAIAGGAAGLIYDRTTADKSRR